MFKKILPVAVAAAALMIGSGVHAETRVTYKSAKSTSSYYQMAVQIAEAMKSGTKGGIIVTVEESQGSVQNVKEAAKRKGNYVFTTPPVLIKLAQAGTKMFKPLEAYKNIRGLFVIPSLTMQYVVSEKSGIKSFADLDGKTFIIGKGSFGAKEAAKNFKTFGLEGKVKLAKVELNAAVPALKNGKVDGFATAGSYPAPNVIEAAAGMKVRVLSMSEEQVKQTKRTRIVIPAGTYPGVDSDVVTTSLPVGAYTTTAMDNDTAYKLTRTYWEQKAAMGKTNPWWNGVSGALLSTMGGKLHPGALRYYNEAGIKIADHLKP